MAKTVFISRDPDEDSVFANQLRAAGWQVHGFSLVTLTPLPIGDIPETDWIFFASKNAVKFFFEGGVSREDEVSWAALGPATARALLRYTHRVDFTGTGDPATTAAAFKPLAQGKKVLFPAARQSQRSVPDLLGDAISALYLPVYDNVPVSDPPLLEDNVLVFTSPMNARAYFGRHRLSVRQRVVAIGQTTAAELAVLGISGVLISEEPTESALAATVLALGQ